MVTPTYRVHLIANGETATIDIDDDDRKRYLARELAIELPLIITLERSEPLTAHTALPSKDVLDTFERLGLESEEAQLDCSAEIEFLLRDDNTTIEYIAPGTGDKVTGTREEIQRGMHDSFGADLDLTVLTLENPKLRRTFSIDVAQ